MQKVVAYLFLLLFLPGCSSVYRDAGIHNTSSASPAILIHENPIQSGIIIERIDDKWRGVGVFKKYELMPGAHSLLIALNQPHARGEKVIVRFQAGAGEVYRLEGKVDTWAKRWAVWVIEDSTGKKFEGAKP